MNEMTTPRTPADILLANGVFDASSPTDLSARLEALLKQMEERRPVIEAALAYTPGTHNYDVLLGMILQGQLAFWPLPNSFMLTEIHTFPLARHFHIFLAGGHLEELVHMHGDVIELARALQCDKLTLAGRPGWERALKRHGWSPYLVTLAKEI